MDVSSDIRTIMNPIMYTSETMPNLPLNSQQVRKLTIKAVGEICDAQDGSCTMCPFYVKNAHRYPCMFQNKTPKDWVKIVKIWEQWEKDRKKEEAEQEAREIENVKKEILEAR